MHLLCCAVQPDDKAKYVAELRKMADANRQQIADTDYAASTREDLQKLDQGRSSWTNEDPSW